MRRPPRWSPAGSPQSAGLPVDFFATRAHYIDHIAPVWSALDQRGLFCVPDELASHARSRGVKPAPLSELAAGDGPIVTSAYADMSRCTKSQRHLIMFEHGAGFSFSNVHPSYAGGSHDRRFVSLFCEVNDWTQRRNLRTFHDARSHVVGCPKLDGMSKAKRTRRAKSEPVVCVSFHWDCLVAPETRSAMSHYEGVLPEIARQFNLVMHGHPRIAGRSRELADKLGLEYIESFDEVCRRADVYVNDASSTLYEFAALAGPVVVLNAPWYRRGVDHGLRFWDCSDIGPSCDEPEELADAIRAAIDEPKEMRERREDYSLSVFPYMGESAERAAHVIAHLPELVAGEALPPLRPEPLPPGCAVATVDKATIADVLLWHGEAALDVREAEYIAHLGPGVRLTGSLEPAFRALLAGWDCVAAHVPYPYKAATAPRMLKYDERAYFARAGLKPQDAKTWLLDLSFALEVRE